VLKVISTGSNGSRPNSRKYGVIPVTRGGMVEVGDTVLVKIVAWDGKHKLSEHWEDQPYVVLKQPNLDIPVFVVRREDGTGKTEHYIGTFNWCRF
jgi:hypothetical protein